MFICPTHKSELIEDKDGFRCPDCDYTAEKTDGIVFFAPEAIEDDEQFSASNIDKLYEIERKHFWFINKTKIITEVFEKYIKKDRKIIEIGAGTGDISRNLLDKGYNVHVGELYKNGIEYAKTYGAKSLYQFDLTKSPFISEFDVVGMFDVLEHIDDDYAAVKNVYDMLDDKGMIVFSVPALNILWSRHDVYNFHKRRYNKKSLGALLEKCNFDIIEMEYFSFFQTPFLLVRKLLFPDLKNGKIKETDEEKLLKTNKFINWFFIGLNNLENKIFKKISRPCGGSLLVVAKK